MSVKKYTRDTIPANCCPVPFTTLILNPNGDVGCCRERTNREVLGNIKEQSIEEIWNGEEMRAWRREFIEGNVVRCKSQIEERKCNLQDYNLMMLPKTEFTEYQKRMPIRISPDFNGKCNLQCVMCDIWKMENGLYDKIGFWQQAKETSFFEGVDFIDPLAGEPFVQRDFYRLISLMKESSPDAFWRITTNGHWSLSKYIANHLDNIKNLYSIQTSIDGATCKTYSSIRRKGDLNFVIKNLVEQKEYNESRVKRGMRPFDQLVIMTVMRENWKEIPLMIEKMASLEIDCTFNKCNGPEEMMLTTLPIDERKEIVEYLFENVAVKDIYRTYTVIVPLIESLDQQNRLKFKAKFIKMTDPKAFLSLVR